MPFYAPNIKNRPILFGYLVINKAIPASRLRGGVAGRWQVSRLLCGSSGRCLVPFRVYLSAEPAAPDAITRLVLGVCCRGFFTGGAEYIHYVYMLDPGVVGASGYGGSSWRLE